MKPPTIMRPLIEVLEEMRRRPLNEMEKSDASACRAFFRAYLIGYWHAKQLRTNSKPQREVFRQTRAIKAASHDITLSLTIPMLEAILENEVERLCRVGG